MLRKGRGKNLSGIAGLIPLEPGNKDKQSFQAECGIIPIDWCD